MGCCTVEPAALSGNLLIPPSKSMGHRALFCAALAQGISQIDNFVMSRDMQATLDALQALGILTEVTDSARFPGRLLVRVFGTGQLDPTGDVVDCHESGSTARFVIPFSRLHPAECVVTGRNGLLDRPFGLFQTLFQGKGVTVADRGGRLPLNLSGALLPGLFSLRGNVSSQFITGLLFVLPVLEGDSEIRIEGVLESAPYVEMTLEMLARFGVRASLKTFPADETGVGARITIPGWQRYVPTAYDVEGDWSQAAFWTVAGAMGHNLVLSGLRQDSLQGDRAVLDFLVRMGASCDWKDGQLRLWCADGLTGIDMDVSQCPDLVPALSMAAAWASGTSRIQNAARLRIKECDRLAAMRNTLQALGVAVLEEADGLGITGRSGALFMGGRGDGAHRASGDPICTVEGYNDHRVVMAAAIAGTRAAGPVRITDREAVQKSYPAFWTDYAILGGSAGREEP